MKKALIDKIQKQACFAAVDGVLCSMKGKSETPKEAWGLVIVRTGQSLPNAVQQFWTWNLKLKTVITGIVWPDNRLQIELVIFWDAGLKFKNNILYTGFLVSKI